MCPLQNLDHSFAGMLFVIIAHLVVVGLNHYTVTGCAHNDVGISKHGAHNVANVFPSLLPRINFRISIRGHSNDTPKEIRDGLLHYIEKNGSWPRIVSAGCAQDVPQEPHRNPLPAQRNPPPPGQEGS